jgi:DedD protein
VETRIKERLTGALILVAALVILVPEIFSGHHIAKPAREAPPAAPATEGPPLRTYTTETDAIQPAPVESASVSEPAAPTPSATPPPAPAPASVAAAEETPAPSPPPVAATVTKPAPAAKPDAVASDTAPPARGQWFVQVGSFSQAANADRYARQLREQGFTSIVLPPAGAKGLSRVRVGPVRNREAAAALLERLKAGGHKGAVVGS